MILMPNKFALPVLQHRQGETSNANSLERLGTYGQGC